MNLKQELVKQGWCWWYRKYAPEDMVLEGLENEAQEARMACDRVEPSPAVGVAEAEVNVKSSGSLTFFSIVGTSPMTCAIFP
jgi:hypothetical protein